GICDGVLAGGQYDKMMAKMGRKSGAVGFAIYLDLLEQLEAQSDYNRVDVLLLYNDKTCSKTVAAKVRELTESGKSVNAQKSIPEKIKYKEIIDIREGEADA
ncbi:MAG: hypothetical protein IJU45_04715, partial [Clostridia bacterium]|nr:hypothetical protein [Clostridia bacterium]